MADPSATILDVRFGARYGELNERFYRRLDVAFGFIGLFGGSAVVVGAFGSYPWLSGISGVLIAACAIIERLVRPVEKAIEHRDFKKRFADLDARAPSIAEAELQAALRRLQMEAPQGMASLAIPAFNANLRSNGRDDAVVRESKLETFMASLS